MKLLVTLFILGLVLRLANLASLPFGFHSDEARLAWNSYSLLKTGRDDHWHPFPLYYDTFGDSRPTGLFYLTTPALVLFGNNIFAARFVSSFFGGLGIIAIFAFVYQITKNKHLSYLSALFLTISPWHIEVSRATSEMVVCSTIFIIASTYFVKNLKNSSLQKILLVIILCLVSYWCYHSIRILAPLFFIVLWFFHAKNFKSAIHAFTIIFTLICITLALSLTPSAKSRFNQVSIFNDEDVQYQISRLKSELPTPSLSQKILDNKFFVFTQRFLNQYPQYFEGDFFFGNSAKPYRYVTPGTGLITYIEFIFFIVGILVCVQKKPQQIFLFLLALSPFPAALTTEDSPNLHRAFLMVFFVMTIQAYGAIWIWTRKNRHIVAVRSFILAIFLINLAYVYHMYALHATFHKPFIKNYSLDGSSYRNVGATDLALTIYKQKHNYEKIYVANKPDDLYPWYAFFTYLDPQQNKFSLNSNGNRYIENIIFTLQSCPSDTAFTQDAAYKILVIDAASPHCAYESQIKDGLPAKISSKIIRPDKSDIYVFLTRSGSIPHTN